MKKVSFLMSLYKEPNEYIKDAINSILNQTYDDFELILINDNPLISRNMSEFGIDKRQSNNIILINNKENMGLALSMNKAASFASGEFLARLDADDVASSNRIQEQVKIANNTNCDLVFSPSILIDDFGKEIGRTKNYYGMDISSILPFGNPIIHSSALIRASTFEKVGGYHPYIASQDYDLWLRMLSANSTFISTKDFLIKRRIQNESISYKRSYQQLLSRRYAVQQYFARLRGKGKDFDYNDYYNFLHRNKYEDSKKSMTLSLEIQRLENATNGMERLLTRLKSEQLRKDLFIGIWHKALYNFFRS